MQLESLVEKMAGLPVLLTDPKEVRQLLFDQLKLQLVNSRTTKKGNPTVDAEVTLPALRALPDISKC